MWVKNSVKQLLLDVIAVGLCKVSNESYDVVASVNGNMSGRVVLKRTNKKEAINLIEAFEQAIRMGDRVFEFESIQENPMSQ